MKKKLAMMGVGAVAGSMLLMSSVYAGVGEAPGYNAYKSAIKNTAAVKNVTERMNLSIEDNGKVLLQVNSTGKTNKEAHTGSADITLKGEATEQSFQIYHQEDKTIIKTDLSDTYQIIEPDKAERDMLKKHKDHIEQFDPAMAKDMENVIDELAGNLKNYVTLKEESKTKEVEMHLTGTQIPAVANAIGSLFIKASGRDHGEEMNLSSTLGVNVNNIKDSLPKLTDDIKIDSVNLDATVNADNRITNQTAAIEISGKDRGGTAHHVIVKVDLGLSEFNNTTPDTVNLTGKKVENVKPFMP
ncbi:hypothetical protein PASE110613_07255 [Paenibacillus sediminis]|uniref:Uncharacterized protein n=1 Tax=Paenibacillus sediminis TaxID=664909 RepID=A0ABS4H318_9BACL|nr:hypothetical protein [Paenibacillus sediminis]MBP1936866.1 hypothetical protein [Paenibacillus sediminis]